MNKKANMTLMIDKIIEECRRIESMAFEHRDNPVNKTDKIEALATIENMECLIRFLKDIKKEEPVSDGSGVDVIKEELERAVKIYKPSGDFGWGTLYNIATHFVEWQKQKDLDAALGGDALWVEHCNGYHEGQADMKEKVKMVKGWFKDIAEMCERLTSGNVSHLGKTIRSLANRSAEFIDSDIL